MKSHRSAGQHTLNGKKHKTLGCGCCTVSDLREKHAKQYEHKDMQERLADTEKSMTDKELIAMAQEAGFPIVTLLSGNVLIAGNAKRRFRRLVELAQEAEREACAKVCEAEISDYSHKYSPANCAAMIRLRGAL